MLTARLRISTWLLLGWCAFIASWILVNRAKEPMCLLGWTRCGEDLWLEPGSSRPIAAVGVAGVVVLLVLWWLEGRREKVKVDALAARTVRPVVLGVLSFVGVLGAAHLMLFAPVDDKLPCGEPIRINAVLAYPLNCDSGLFMELAHNPGDILEPNSVRQSRPGYVALGAAATAVIGPIAEWAGLNDLYAQDDTAFIPLVLINFVIGALALALFVWLMLRLGAPPGVTLPLAAIFAINDVTKAYYWSPHQQMFSLLVPIGTILVCRWLLLRRPSWRQVGVLALGLGLIALVYGSVLITVAAAGLVLLWSAWTNRRQHDGERAANRTRATATVIGKVLLLGAIAAVPTAAWMAICRAVTGTYYNHEVVVYRQFVWIPESAREGWAVLREKVANASAMTAIQMIEVTWLLSAVLVILAIAAVLARVGLGPVTAEHRAVLIGTALTGVLTLIFLWGMGLWAYRLTFHIVPVFLVAIGWVSTRLSVLSARAALATQIFLGLLAAAWVAFQLVSHGPYS
ncbi:hypothetical protein [Allorhizocola rhizosphaerae]|uniref:hypothetical protein n=1 Tax=Allorhizocola rhizosphaerae TaxID=1872709 RepID=UPI000E3BDF89|nr:hypothetical protein [Allorhizocola rhizosphaerae]